MINIIHHNDLVCCDVLIFGVEIDARKALLALEREGLIQLPAARIHPQQLREQGKQPPPQQTPVEVALHELGEVTLVAVSKELTR